MSKKKRKQARCSSVERRQRQDRQAFLLYGLIAVVAAIGMLWTSAESWSSGALQGALAPLFIIMLRYLLRVTTGHRRDPLGMLTAAIFLIIFSAVLVCFPPLSLWSAPLVILALVATVIGLHRFHLSPIFMLVNCMVAGAILL